VGVWLRALEEGTDVIFSFGYRDACGDVFAELVELLDARVLDVRARPHGQRGWRGADLARQFGERYEWHGENLGGRAFRNRSETWQPAPLDVLRPIADRAKGEHLILLCACAEPWSCHRHHELAEPLLLLGTETFHILDDQIIEASDLAVALRNNTSCPSANLCDWLDSENPNQRNPNPMPSTDPNDPLWQLRARVQKLPAGDELDAMLVQLQVEREKVRAILDAMHVESTHDLSLIDLAEGVSALYADMERQKDDLLDYVENVSSGMLASDGYHSFATALDWKYPDGEPMPIWAHLPADIQDAFVAFCNEVTRNPLSKRNP